jgi:hypothetical protein
MGGDLDLHDVPMFDETAVFNAEDVDGYHWLGGPPHVAPMDHDDAAFCHDHSWLVAKPLRKRAHKGGNGITSIRYGRIVLDVIWGE